MEMLLKFVGVLICILIVSKLIISFLDYIHSKFPPNDPPKEPLELIGTGCLIASSRNGELSVYNKGRRLPIKVLEGKKVEIESASMYTGVLVKIIDAKAGE